MAKETAKERAVRELRELREVFAHSKPVQDGLAVWWGGLSHDDRRLCLAFCGLDDSERSAKRAWQQLTMEHRDMIVGSCKAFYRVVEPLRFA